jgi:hypothetical protein
MPAPFARSFAVAALMSATMLASPLSAARADTVANAAFQLAQASTPSSAPPPATAAQAQAGTGATEGKTETVEQRISSLHDALKITPAEDTKWNAVAKAMRENASEMDKLVTESRSKSPENMSAVEDLKLYQKFAEAHVSGLKNLISSFSSLYSAMPEAQKKTADSVFAASREAKQANAAHS